jgi:peptidoglycan hydrolase-like protein with peptidoglycan-binding domain
MKNKYVKIAVFTALGLGAIYGGWKIYTTIRRKNELDFSDSEITSSNESEKTSVKEPSFDSNKIVFFGSRGGEVKTIQTALNNIIIDAYKSKDGGFTGDKETRRKTIANIPKLKVDGIFGVKTQEAISIIMGKSKTSYSEVKQKRIDFANAYGLPKPY